jgi:predicted nucleic acid-binding protein
VKKLLVDAGPLIALFDASDQHHKRVISQVKRFDDVLVSTWPVVTEVHHMLDFNVQAQLNFMEWISLGGLKLMDLLEDDIDRIIELTTKYRDVPMDLADASLVVISEYLNTNRILSIDSDFLIFRNRFKDYLVNELD